MTAMTLPKPKLIRIASIDIHRALIMLLMIFVNDLWSLRNIPQWLEHTPADYDGMGLADVVFPAFLFIVGLSIPFAIRNRITKGETLPEIAGHILLRSVALITMGFFHVNFENILAPSLPISKPVFEILMTIAFFLIWNVYPKDGRIGKVSTKWLQVAGILLLGILAFIYRGSSPDNLIWMRPYWWGILGLIGWSYLVSSLVYLFARQRFWLISAVVILFCFLNFQEFSPLFNQLPKVKVIISASNYSLVMCGVLASALFMQLENKLNMEWKFAALLILLAAVFIGYGFEVRPLGGISKIKATPSWTAICAGISFCMYGLIFLIADKFRLIRWARIIEPAGSMTLTCYLVPYIIYPVFALVNWKWPEMLSTGIPGLFKSLFFALSIIWITGLLGKLKIKLRI
jgi:heparan-alpha-glucosaminide N-acetyltransferase